MTELNALQWAGAVFGSVSLFLLGVAWANPAGSEDRAVLGAYGVFLLLVACVFAGLGIAKQTGVMP